MRAAVVPKVHGKWEVKEVPTPIPGPNQVLMKIHASGLCYTDVYTTEGMLRTQFPRTIGQDPPCRRACWRAIFSRLLR
jgi:D-arabinose 1-dehydrogenase-like Zn-dependent alcohol dehydrogenase